MRLLSFVPCGCRAGPIDDAPPHALPTELQRCSGDGGASARQRRRRRERARSLGSPQWRPSLGDIYEEYSTADAGKSGGRVVPAMPGKPAARDFARVLPRAHSHDYRHIETASSMPAFAPTAFLF